MPRKENPGPLSAQQQQDLVSEGIDNFELPKSLVTKIAKSAVPDNTKIQKEAILSLVKGSTVFINYLAATAHDVAQSKQHKSISASDVLKALEMIELGDLVDPLSAELQVYRDQVKPDKNGGSAARRASTASASVNGHTAASASTASKAKGKEKASTSVSAAGTGPSAAPVASVVGGVETLPPPFTSAPLIHRGEQPDHNPLGGSNVAINPAVEEPEDQRMEVDNEGHESVGADIQGDAEMDDVADEPEEEQDDPGEQSDVEDEGQDEEEEVQNVVAIEQEEIHDDARGAASEHKE
ncbi:histone-fold-containing protein [Lentinula boryana]|uniref:DNA polymerase epsilon subunit D n=1 Tax=Lentinula boryana TaxID=40481 RepID=A0ABQ8Q593_9AGAR|nr:histone-fold-containing protein [Lentinula boryana]